jgi:hypothetical protein
LESNIRLASCSSSDFVELDIIVVSPYNDCNLPTGRLSKREGASYAVS